MKNKPLLTLIFILIGFASFGQENYKWDKVIDSLEGDKNQLYTKTKLFIGEKWKSPEDVIMSDDKEAGVVLIKGLNIQELHFHMSNHRWTFSYTIKLLMKDSKCRIIIENVHCASAKGLAGSGLEWPILPISNEYPASNGKELTAMNEERYLSVMSSLKRDLQSIVNSYVDYIKKPIVDNPDW